MDMEDQDVRMFVVLHQILMRSFVFFTILARLYAKFVLLQNRKALTGQVSYSMTKKLHPQLHHLRRIIDIGDAQCVVNLRMNRNAFARLCYLLNLVGGLCESKYVRVEEKVAMFLSILAHHKKNRIVSHDYMRSGYTVSTHFHEVLKSVLKLHHILLVKPVPIEEGCNSETWKWFKGCLGALDGTYVSVHVSNNNKARYRTRKGTTALNILGVCDREMRFIYALTGWEGSAADARVLRDAIHRHDGLKVPRGQYYLCDNGYGNVDGFLTPYRRVRYHRDAWGNGASGPQNYKEFYNFKHSSARNVIERAFGLLKRRWAILRSPSFYPIKVQNRIVMACMLLHNFVRIEMPDDPLAEVDDANIGSDNVNDHDFIDNIESSPRWDGWRDNLAMSMYQNYANM